MPPAPAGAPLPLWPPLLAARVPGGQSALHAHHGMHFVLAVTGELCVATPSGPGPQRTDTRWQRAAGVLTAPDAPHALDARGCDVLIVFLDPESAAGRALSHAPGGPVWHLDASTRQDLLTDTETLMGAGGPPWLARAAERLGGRSELPPRTTHPRVRKLLRLLQSGTPPDASLAALAAAVDLSSSRLMHVFTESVGIPLRPYLAWLKLQRAAAAVVSGMPLAQAAHAAGFADASHMTRTFRRMLGVTPRELQQPA